MKRVLILLLLASSWACATDTKSKTTEAQRSDDQNVTASNSGSETPLSACKSIVKKTVAKDFQGVQDLSIIGRGPMVGPRGAMYPGHMGYGMGQGPAGAHPGREWMEKNFETMHKERMAELEKLNCTSETIAGDRAFVEASTDKGKRLVPFVKTDGGWRFDTRTYMSFYNVMGPEPMNQPTQRKRVK